MSDIETTVAALPLERAHFEAVVAALADESGIADYDVVRLKEGAGNPTSVGVWRVSGATVAGAGWSFVAKGVTLPSDVVFAHHTPSGLNYWRREVDAYGSDAFAGLPDGLRIPHSYGSIELAPDLAILFLEDLGSVERESWRKDDYLRAADLLGCWQASAVRESVTKYEWANTDLLRKWHDLTASYWRRITDQAEAGDERLVRFTRAGCDPDFRSLFSMIYDPEPVLQALDTVPHSWCHNDANIDNLVYVANGSEAELVMFDIQWFGWSPVGSDLGQLLCQIQAELDGDSRQAIDAQCLAIYGRYFNSDDVRSIDIEFSYCAAAALRQFCFSLALETDTVEAFLAAGDDVGLAQHVERFFYAKRGGPLPGLADRAYELLSEL